MMNNKIISIHHLRGLAALLVVMFHFRGYLNGVYAQNDLGSMLFGAGAFGVDLFFMISGFIIALSTRRTSSTAIFAIRRFFRIYPAFIIIFSIGAFTVYSNNSTTNLVRAMFFLHKDYTLASPGFGFNILGPAWTLSYEIYFYTLFVLAMTISHKYRTLLASFFILMPVVLTQLVTHGSLSFAGTASPQLPLDTPIYSLIRFSSSPILVEFVLGMMLYELHAMPRVKISKNASTLVFAGCVGVFLTFYFSKINYIFGMTGFGLWSVILLAGALLYDKSVGFKESTTLDYLGNVSFSLYISHYLVINALDFYKPHFWEVTFGVSRILLATTLCLIVATIMYVLVEKPFIAVGKKIESSIKARKTTKVQLEDIIT
ncbi:acyltransferase [Enterobacteriaceae bacterium H16N7]|nr:acyltransferase [Dryocola clanedunensis]